MANTRLQSAVRTILAAAPEFSALVPQSHDRLANHLWDRLRYLDSKFAQSPYGPQSRQASAQYDFLATLLEWVRQFPPAAKAGAVLIALSIHYFTEPERRNLLDACISQFRAIHGRGLPGYSPRLFPLTSHTEIHAAFARNVGIEGTGDNRMLPPTHLEEFIFQATAAFARVAAHQPPSIYDYPENYFWYLAHSHCIIVEDWTLSGNTLTTTCSHLLRLCKLLFGSSHVGPALVDAGFHPPKISLVLPIATKNAIARLDHALEHLDGASYIARPFITPCVLDESSCLGEDRLPAWISHIQTSVPALPCRALLDATLRHFDDRAGRDYSAYMTLEGFPARLLDGRARKYGFGSGGWVLVSSSNCPNNSLPLLWFSSTSDAQQYSALFPRVASKHNSRALDVTKWLDEITHSPYMSRQLFLEVGKIVRAGPPHP